MKRQQSLAFLVLDGDEAHVRPTDRPADRLRVGGIGLVPLHVVLCVLRRDQSHFVTKVDKLTHPAMRARASLHPDQA
jgi:hypothetical protein